MPKPDRTAWLFSFNCFAATLLALLIGFWIDLPRPYWAVMTIYIISQPLAGAVRSKAIFRVIGTFMGAAFAVLAVPVLVDFPALLCLALAVWMGGGLFISLLDRTPRAYILMLAGYTAALIALPSVNSPQLIFDIAVSRVEEIGLGIFCATLTHSLFFPRPVGAVLQQRLSAWLADGDAWALDLLRQSHLDRAVADRQHLAAAATEIHLLSVLLPFDTSALRDTGAVVRATHQRLLFLIPILSGIADRLTALRGQTDGIQPELTAVADWIAQGCDDRMVPALVGRLESAMAAQRGGDWFALLRESLLCRVLDLLTNLGQAHQLLVHMRQPQRKLSAELAASLGTQTARPLHRDVGMAAMSGLSAALSILLVSAFGIATGWPEGGISAALAGIFCALFAAMDDPAPAIIGFGLFSGLGILISALYLFVILPRVDGFPMLALLLAPPFLVFGAGMLDRRTALPALSILIGIGNSMALQESYSADFATFFNTNTAQYVGLWVALVMTRSLRSMSVDVAARRLLVQTWTTLAGLAHGGRHTDLVDLASQLVDRLGLLTPKLAQSGVEGVNALADLRVAMNLSMLQQHRSDFSPLQWAAIEPVLTETGRHFAQRAADHTVRPSDDLLTTVNAALSRTLPLDQRGAVSALVGLRRNLFPHAAPLIIAEAP